MKTKKMITLGILAAAVCLGLLFQPQTALAASRGTGEENGAGMPDARGRQGEDAGAGSSHKGGSLLMDIILAALILFLAVPLLIKAATGYATFLV